MLPADRRAGEAPPIIASFERVEGSPQSSRRTRRKQAIRDADITRMRQRITRIKKTWRGDSSRQALRSTLAARQYVLDRAKISIPMQQRLRRGLFLEPTGNSDRETATPILNAVTRRLLTRAREKAVARRQQETIRSAILQRYDLFETDVGAVLRSLSTSATSTTSLILISQQPGSKASCSRSQETSWAIPCAVSLSGRRQGNQVSSTSCGSTRDSDAKKRSGCC